MVQCCDFHENCPLEPENPSLKSKIIFHPPQFSWLHVIIFGGCGHSHSYSKARSNKFYIIRCVLYWHFPQSLHLWCQTPANHSKSARGSRTTKSHTSGCHTLSLGIEPPKRKTWKDVAASTTDKSKQIQFPHLWRVGTLLQPKWSSILLTTTTRTNGS